METIMTMFASFVALVSGLILITETVNKIFKIENKNTKLIISWVLSIVVSALGFYFQLGFFTDCGDITTWQGWVKTGLIGLGCGLCANNIYKREEIWRLLEMIFGMFKKKVVK